MEDNKFNEVKSKVLSLLQEEGIQPNEWSVIMSEASKVVRHNITKSEGYIQKEYFSYDMGLLAYRYILDNGGTAQEALEYAIKVFNKPEEWLEETKNQKYFYSKRVVDSNENHEQQILMTRNGTIDKSALRNTNTVNELIRKLSKSKVLSDQLESLRESDSEQCERIRLLEASKTTIEAGLDKINGHLVLEGLTNKEKAVLLIDKGFSNKVIIEVLGIPKATLYRWRKDRENPL